MYEWPDRPHEPRHPHARARPDHRPGPRRGRSPAGTLHRPRQGVVRHRPDHRRRRQLHRRGRLARRRPRAADRPLPLAGLVVRLGRRPASAGTRSAPEPPTPPATSSPTSRRGTGSATATTRSRSPTSTCGERACKPALPLATGCRVTHGKSEVALSKPRPAATPPRRRRSTWRYPFGRIQALMATLIERNDCATSESASIKKRSIRRTLVQQLECDAIFVAASNSLRLAPTPKRPQD